MLSLTREIGQEVRGPDGEVLGRLVDLTVRLGTAAGPHLVDRLLVRRRGAPLAGAAAGRLFAVGLIGAALLAASVLPLSTAYSVSEYAGTEAALDDPYREARPFYLTFGLVTVLGATAVLIPGVPLATILVATQVLNAVLLVPLLVVMIGIGRDRDLMGRFAVTQRGTLAYGATTAVVVACVAALAVTSVVG